MEEMKAKTRELCGLQEKLIDAVQAEMAKGCVNVNTHEMGAVIDMIKDLYEAEEKCWKACYYKKIVEAMDEEEMNPEMQGRMGYDNWRYSSGRYAPKGHGHRSGYVDMDDLDGMEYRGSNPWANMNKRMPETHTDYMGDHDRMGYSGSPRGDRYERYRSARMGYHDSKDQASKEHMDMAAREYVVDMAEAVKEMWREADPNMKKEIKNKFVALTSELN